VSREECTVRVDLGDRSYPIRIGTDSLADLGAAVARATGAARAMLITEPPVGRRYAARVMRSLREAGLRPRRFDVPSGDRSKSLRQAGKLYEALLDAGADRSTVVVALGGGMVGDLAGFVAATLLRGIPFVQVPTTILAMIDSAVGGKTGVNLARGKNLVGAFHQPRLVWEDPRVLESLPLRVRAAGMAEVIKHAAIWDPELFESLERDVERALALETGVIVPVLEQAVRVKAEVVSRDERESNLRMLLNFGHTLGHAVESLKRYRGVLHGEAVAMGMAYAARRSEELGTAPEGTAARLVALLERANLPTELPEFPRRAYLAALAVDKKKRDARIHFVVLRGIGRADTVPLLPREVLPAGRPRG
jgi:3-dehydroquinate synthase